MMATQTMTTQMVQFFRQNGLTRMYPSFFGQGLKGQPLFGQRKGVTPQVAMLCAFRMAGLTVAEANFFGLPRNGSVNQPVITPQSNTTPAPAVHIFTMPQRSDQAA